MKHADEQCDVGTLIADRHPFKGFENYFTDSLLYQDQLEAGPELELPDSGNEADAKLESDDDCPWELYLTVVDQKISLLMILPSTRGCGILIKIV